VVLPVSNAFHSPSMNEAGAELARYMDRMDWRDPRIPVYLNVTARPEPSGPAMRDIMKQQMTSSVHWIQTIQNQFADGMRTFLELGPRGVLSRMVGQILGDRDGVRVASVGTLEQAAKVEELLS